MVSGFVFGNYKSDRYTDYHVIVQKSELLRTF
jgi:hypothetical protein